MENFKLMVGATTLYMKEESVSTRTARFIADNEGKKIFIHNYNEEENEILVSKYENWEKHKIPITLIEKIEEETEENKDNKEIEKNEVGEDFKFKMIVYIINNKKTILGIFIGVFIYMLLSNIFINIKSNILESKKQEITETGSVFDILTQRDFILQQKENFEYEKQKNTREEKRQAIKNFDNIINSSIEAVKQIKIEREEITKQKIELAQ